VSDTFDPAITRCLTPSSRPFTRCLTPSSEAPSSRTRPAASESGGGGRVEACG